MAAASLGTPTNPAIGSPFSAGLFFGAQRPAASIRVPEGDVPSSPHQVPHPSISTIRTLKAAGDYAAADSVAAATLESLQAVHGATDGRLTPWLLMAGSLRHDLGRFEEAEGLFRRALSIASDSRHPEGLDALAALRGITRAQLRSGKLPEAEATAEQCIRLSERLCEKMSLCRAIDLSLLAEVRMMQDRLREAEGLLDSAIDIAEAIAGADHKDLGDLLENRGWIANSMGKHNDAAQLFNRSLAIQTMVWGKDHPKAAGPSLGLASVCNNNGAFLEAEALYRRCLTVLERAFGPAHPNTATAACGLAVCLSNLADFVSAERVLRRCLEASTATYGESTATAGELMPALAEVLAMLGRHAESTRLFRRAAEITEDVHGPDHSRNAAALSGLAHTKRRIGNNVDAETLYRKAIGIIERRHGSPHPDLIRYRCRLGMCLSNLNRNHEGLESIERGIAEAVEIYGKDSYQVALEERHLGILLWRLKRAEESHSVLLRSLNKLEEYLGLDHPYLSKCLKGLAQASLRLGLFEDAHDYISRAVALHKNAPGSDQTELTHLLSLKVTAELYLQEWDSAVETTSRAAGIALSELERIYRVSSTSDAILSALMPKAAARNMVSSALANPALHDSTLAEAFSMVAITHGQILDWLAERQKLLDLASDTTQVARLRETLATATQHVADLVVGGPPADEKAYLEELAEARREEEEAERALSEASERLRSAGGSIQPPRRISTEDVAAILNLGETLIHFVRFNRWLHPKSVEVRRQRAHYGAFRLKKGSGASNDIDFIDLGPAASLDSLVFAYRSGIDDVGTGRRPSAREEANYRLAARRLFERVWEPLFPLDDETYDRYGSPDSEALVFLVPDSWLNLLDFNTLLAPTGELVIERWKLHYLSSCRDLLRSASTSTGAGLLAVGDPCYVPRPKDNALAENGVEGKSTFSLCAEAHRYPGPLPGAERETRGIAALFEKVTDGPVTVLLGENATEMAFRQSLSGNRMVHIAAHGFYCEEAKRERRAYVDRVANSLFLSGLYLASDTENDGLLTAYEVTCLDLRDVDWVVLSACGSGLGRLVEGEGLFGLRRAFEIAGARTVIMALWRINDNAARALMEQILQNRLAGNSTVDSIRQAQLRRLREQRRRLNRIHPVLWGGIIAEGDWR